MKKQKSSWWPIVYGIIIVYGLVGTNALYYTAYTVDYLLNRHKYVFTEEGSHKDNKFDADADADALPSILRKYMDWSRETRLRTLPRIPSEPLPELSITAMTPEIARKISDNFSKPFVIRGMIRDFDCVKKWDLDYFESEYGDVEVPVFDNLTNSTNVGKIKKCNTTNNLCSIHKICRDIRDGKPLYVNNISTLFTVSEQARKELNLDEMSKLMNSRFFSSRNKPNDFMSQLFLGGKNTGTSLHCAANINFFFNVKGEKHWGFIDPAYTSLINCKSSAQGLYSNSVDDFFSESSPFSRIPRYETVLKPGDVLYNPAWYWHAVKNLTEYTIAVANRSMSFDFFTGELPFIKNNLFFSFLQIFSPK